jgi:TonB family protein
MLVPPDGTFEFLNVRPGNYTVNVSTPVPVQPIVVGTQDVSGLEFTVPATRTLSGRMIIDGSTSAVPAGLRLLFTVSYPNGSVGIGSTVQADGSFSVLMPQGEHRIALGSIPGYATRSIVFGSTDLLREPLRLTATDTAQLEVTFARTQVNVPGPGTPAVPPAGTPVPGGAVTPPVLLSQVQASYTDLAREARLEGTVKLQATVLQDGTLNDIQVVQGLGMGLDEAAVAAVRQWRFRPAMRNGEPVATRLGFEVNFRLR